MRVSVPNGFVGILTSFLGTFFLQGMRIVSSCGDIIVVDGSRPLISLTSQRNIAFEYFLTADTFRIPDFDASEKAICAITKVRTI